MSIHVKSALLQNQYSNKVAKQTITLCEAHEFIELTFVLQDGIIAAVKPPFNIAAIAEDGIYHRCGH